MTARNHGRRTLTAALCLSALVWAASVRAEQRTNLAERGLKRVGQAGLTVVDQLKKTGVRLTAIGKKLIPVKFGEEGQQQAQPAVPPKPDSTGEAVEAESAPVCPFCQGGWPGGPGSARARYLQQSRVLQRALARKFAYFIPSGCGGTGCPPYGCYHFVYPVKPDYFDPRDGQIFAAQGVGVPVAVPLAPVVHYQFNYSWGIPASRITPLGDRIELKRVDY